MEAIDKLQKVSMSRIYGVKYRIGLLINKEF